VKYLLIFLVLTWPHPILSAHEGEGKLCSIQGELGVLFFHQTWWDPRERILAEFHGATTDELNYILKYINVVRLFDGLDGPRSTYKQLPLLYDFLSRYSEIIEHTNRARLISALHKRDLSEMEIQFIEKLFTTTKGRDLSKLKRLIDLGGDHLDLEKLIFRDVDKHTRTQLLNHFYREGLAVDHPHLKVMSDIDDTLYASRSDTRFPRYTIYPGIRAFFDALDRGICSEDDCGDLIFLTARPNGPQGTWEGRSHALIRRLGIRAAILSGTLLGLLSHRRMAAVKLKNFERFKQLYPEYNFVFLGDSGQGDMLVGRDMLDRDSNNVKAIFIHDLGNTKVLSIEKQTALAKKGVYLFKTYVGAAVIAYHLGLITMENLIKVADQAHSEFNAIAFDNELQKAEAFKALLEDIDDIQALTSE
jgi:hypothetical protein